MHNNPFSEQFASNCLITSYSVYPFNMHDTFHTHTLMAHVGEHDWKLYLADISFPVE